MNIKGVCLSLIDEPLLCPRIAFKIKAVCWNNQEWQSALTFKRELHILWCFIYKCPVVYFRQIWGLLVTLLAMNRDIKPLCSVSSIYSMEWIIVDFVVFRDSLISATTSHHLSFASEEVGLDKWLKIDRPMHFHIFQTCETERREPRKAGFE